MKGTEKSNNVPGVRKDAPVASIHAHRHVHRLSVANYGCIYAALALAQIKHPDAVELLVRTLEDNDKSWVPSQRSLATLSVLPGSKMLAFSRNISPPASLRSQHAAERQVRRRREHLASRERASGLHPSFSGLRRCFLYGAHRLRRRRGNDPTATAANAKDPTRRHHLSGKPHPR